MTLPTSLNLPFKTIACLGLGLIGGSLARLVRHQLPETRILALDTPEVMAAAQQDGTIHQSLSGVDDPVLRSADLVILGTHLCQSYDLLRTLAKQADVTHPLNVMDLGSTKAGICAVAESLPPQIRFIGGHPMAGREVSGYTNGRWDLFVGKRFLLTPCQRTTPELKEAVTQWLTSLNLIPIYLDTAEHDHLMSLVSHFPQFYAVALANLLHRQNPERVLHFLGGGIDDQMRLMASPYTMWRDVFQENKTDLDATLAQFIDILTDMRTDLASDQLDTWFDRSHEVYQRYQTNKTEVATTRDADPVTSR